MNISEIKARAEAAKLGLPNSCPCEVCASAGDVLALIAWVEELEKLLACPAKLNYCAEMRGIQFAALKDKGDCEHS